MRAIVPNASQFVCEWTAKQLKMGKPFPEGSYGMGILWEDRLIAGVVYHDLTEHNVFVSLASTSPLWASRMTLRAIFSYPFNQVGVARVSAILGPRNPKWRRMMRDKIGFHHEIKLIDWFGEGNHGHLYRMLRGDCRWIEHEKQQPERTAV